MINITYLLSFLIFAFTSSSKTTVKLIKVDGGSIAIEKDQMISVEPFLIDEREVTLADFADFVQKNNYKTIPERMEGCRYWSRKSNSWEMSDTVNWRHDLYGYKIPKNLYEYYPVTNITVQDAKAFASYHNKRLPTLNEWIFAAAGGTKSKKYKFSGSNKYREVAWVDNNAREVIQKVKTKQPNELGIYDMSGNVHEFVLLSTNKVYARGGCYFSNWEFARIVDAGWEVKENESFPTFGFRCVRDVTN